MIEGEFQSSVIQIGDSMTELERYTSLEKDTRTGVFFIAGALPSLVVGIKLWISATIFGFYSVIIKM